MKDLHSPEIEKFRVKDNKVLALYGNFGDSKSGVFRMPERPSIAHDDIMIIASSEDGWDHVSVSLEERCPTWEEMEAVKRLFFEDDEWVMQLHAPPSQHISVHPYCLHMWRPHDKEIPVPPRGMVA